MNEINPRVRELMEAALRSHGMNPDDPEIAAEIDLTMRLMTRIDQTPNCPLCDKPPAFVIGDTALCGDDECKTLFWDRSKTMDQLILNMGLVDLRGNPPGSGSPFNEFDDRPDS
jgi:hypothetical protein